ncbi:hypothetical protein KY285_012983 [Solanum tuberosum]|nr:hypothetical protein KY285_012983 [Solanum tuberosum]
MTTPKQTFWIIRKIFYAKTWYKDDVGPTGERKKLESNIQNNYVTLRPQYPQVEWKHLGVQVDANCVLCNTGHMENFDHIFYACPYSSYVWKAMLNWLGYHRQISS